MLHVFSVYSLLVLTDIPLHGYTTTIKFIFFFALGLFLVFTVRNKATMNFLVKSLCGLLFLFLLGKYPGVK